MQKFPNVLIFVSFKVASKVVVSTSTVIKSVSTQSTYVLRRYKIDVITEITTFLITTMKKIFIPQRPDRERA